MTSKWSERKRSIDVLDVLEEWIMINAKPKKIMHDSFSSPKEQSHIHSLAVYLRTISNTSGTERNLSLVCRLVGDLVLANAHSVARIYGRMSYMFVFYYLRSKDCFASMYL